MSDGARKPTDRPGDLEVPDLDFAFSQTTKKVAPPPSSASPKPVAPPAPPPAQPLGGAGAYGSTFDFGDDDDDMEIDRNAVPQALTLGADSQRARERGPGATLELGDNVVDSGRLSTRSHDKVVPRTNYAGGILSFFLVTLFAGGAGYALFRYVYRPMGWNVAPLAERALDGGSATWSGAASMISLTVCITLTIMSMFARPRSLGYGLSALAALVISITMIIITFSVGPDGAPEVPPDGAKLVPWALAVIPIGIAFRLLRNGWDGCFEGEAKTRLQGIVFAALSAVAAFAAVELLLGAGLARLLFHR